MQVPGLRGLRLRTLAAETYHAFDGGDMWTYAAAVAYSVLFALFPFLLFLLALFSFPDQAGAPSSGCWRRAAACSPRTPTHGCARWWTRYEGSGRAGC